MHSQVNNQIANSLNSAENLIKGLYLIVASSNDDESKIVETILEKVQGDIQSTRAAFETLAPGFYQ